MADTATTSGQIGGPADHNALLHLACDLSLPWTQFWLAHNAPPGARINLSARYPDPDWRPMQGWRVDKALAFAHALSVNPWHCLPEHRPLGNQNRARRRIYVELSCLPQSMNATPHREPTGEEVFE